jgi:hypothetical protein
VSVNVFGTIHDPSAHRNLSVSPAEVGTDPGVLPANSVIAKVRFAERSPPPVSGAVVEIVLAFGTKPEPTLAEIGSPK